MRIVLDARKYFDFGIGTYIQNLVAHIAALGEIILLVASEDEKRIHELPAVQKKVNASGKYSLGELFSVAVDANKYKADVFHAPHYTTPFGLKMPCVTTIHDILHIRGEEYFSFPKRLYARAIIGHACRASEAIIVDSEFTKRELLVVFPGIEQKVHVVHLGISHLYFQKYQEAEIKEFQKVHGLVGPTILYTGSIKPHKNVKTLISAFAEIKNKKHLQLVFSGHSLSKDKALCQLIGKMGIQNQIVELGQLSRRELALAYKTASVVVLPSFYEGFGFSVLEAMASGIPSIGARAASIPEVMGDGGILFDPRSPEELTDALEKVLSDSDLRSTMIKKGYKNIERFSWQQCAEKTFNIYREVM
jgi:glycosyltransferase involved in cell wall biosynthesis